MRSRTCWNYRRRTITGTCRWWRVFFGKQLVSIRWILVGHYWSVDNKGRVSWSLSVSVQRKVLRDFTFSDGSYVPAGNVICVPQQAVMRDERYYENPNEFMPFRFVANQEDGEAADQKFTDLKPHFYLWGAAKNPWQVIISILSFVLA